MTLSSMRFQMSLAFLVFSSAGLCQISDKVPVTALQKTFVDDSHIAASFQTVLNFEIRRDDLIVTEVEQIGMAALKPNVSGTREIFYHDQKEIVSAKFTSGNRNSAPKTCGNYEIENVFYSDAKYCSYPYQFSYAGDVIKFESQAQYREARYVTKIMFHDELGVKKRTLVFNIPRTVNLELVEKNFEGFNIKKNLTESADITTVTYTVDDLQAQSVESNSLGMLWYYPHIIVVTKDFQARSGIKKVISSAQDLYGWYASILRQVTNDPLALKNEVSKITATAKTPEEKIRNIYYWVQDNIRYIAFEDGISGFRPESAQAVYSNRYGDCKGMANLTKEMLKIAGFDARLSWIGTNRIPYTYELPSLAVDNHMICVVFNQEKKYILDPTEKFIALGVHGERIQGKEMMIEDGDKFILAKVPVAGADQNLIVRMEDVVLEGKSIKGKGRVSIKGEALKDIIYLSTNIRQEDKKKVFDRIVVSGHSNSDEVKVINEPDIDRDKPLELEYTYGLGNKVTSFDNDLYVEIDWIKKFGDLKIDSGRFSDYYFHRKIKDRVIKHLKVPAGYKVTHLPNNLKRTHADFSFELNFEQKDGVVTYTNEITVKNGIVKMKDFDTWNSIIKELTDTYNDQVIFTKTE